jgi:hypothetical protein
VAHRHLVWRAAADHRTRRRVTGWRRAALGLARPYWLALRAAVVAAIRGLLAAGPPAKYGATGREPLRLLRLRHRLLLFLE